MIGAIQTPSCLGFGIECGVMAKGILVVIAGFVLFVGSVYVMLSFVFGRRMGYLVLAVCFFGWMIVFSALWTFGFWSQGPTTPTNQGPRGRAPAWVALAAGPNVAPPSQYEEFARYPNGKGWRRPSHNDADKASVQSATSAIQSYLAKQGNEERGVAPEALLGALQTQDFVVQGLQFSAHDGVSLAAGRAYYVGGGPETTVYLYHDAGSENRYSWMFLIGSIVGFALHLPFLDRAEKKRKEFLTGGAAPAWFGPA